MSFILDALRKSESERQQDAAPSIARIPMAVPQPRLPAWAIVTMAALGLGVVALAGAWLIALGGPAGTSLLRAGEPLATPGDPPTGAHSAQDARDAARPEEPLLVPHRRASAPAGGTSPLAAALEDDVASGRPGGANTSLAAERADTNPLAMAARTAADSAPSARVERRLAPAPNVPPVEGVPEPYHSVASTLGLPSLTLELLAYGSRPAEQFVFIDGARYTVGDTMPSGARIIAINPRGAVLLVQGRQLQLETR